MIRDHMQWNEVLCRNYPGRERDLSGAEQTLILMYLALGEDTAFHMAKEFKTIMKTFEGKKEDNIKKDKVHKNPEKYYESLAELLKTLSHQSSLKLFLDKMEKTKLLISNQEKSGRKRRPFRINPDVLRNPEGRDVYYIKNKENYISEWSIAPQQIEDFFSKVETSLRGDVAKKRKKGSAKRDDPKIKYHKYWTKISVFDFRTFLLFIYKLTDDYKCDLLKSEILTYLDEEKSDPAYDEDRCPECFDIIFPKNGTKKGKATKIWDKFYKSFSEMVTENGRLDPGLLIEDVDLHFWFLSKREDNMTRPNEYEVQPDYFYPKIYICNMEPMIKIEGFVSANVEPHKVIMRAVLNKHTNFENHRIFETLNAKKTDIENEIGKIQKMEGSNGQYVIIETVIEEGGLEDSEKWTEIQKEIINKAIKMEKAIGSRLRSLT